MKRGIEQTEQQLALVPSDLVVFKKRTPEFREEEEEHFIREPIIEEVFEEAGPSEPFREKGKERIRVVGARGPRQKNFKQRALERLRRQRKEGIEGRKQLNAAIKRLDRDIESLICRKKSKKARKRTAKARAARRRGSRKKR